MSESCRLHWMLCVKILGTITKENLYNKSRLQGRFAQVGRVRQERPLWPRPGQGLGEGSMTQSRASHSIRSILGALRQPVHQPKE